MAYQQPWLTIDTCEQAPIQRGTLSITPQTQVVTLRTPLGVWRWARPEALLVQGEHDLSRVPIHDPTRWICLCVWLAAAVWLLSLRANTYERATRRR